MTYSAEIVVIINQINDDGKDSWKNRAIFEIDDRRLMILEKPNILGIPWKKLSVIKGWVNISTVTINSPSDAYSDHEKHY